MRPQQKDAVKNPQTCGDEWPKKKVVRLFVAQEGLFEGLFFPRILPLFQFKLFFGYLKSQEPESLVFCCCYCLSHDAWSKYTPLLPRPCCNDKSSETKNPQWQMTHLVFGITAREPFPPLWPLKATRVRSFDDSKTCDTSYHFLFDVHQDLRLGHGRPGRTEIKS